MPMPVSPARERVGTELARLRRQAGISGRAMATRLGVSQPTVSRTESGDRLPTLPLAREWLDLVGADEHTRDTVLALVEAGHSETVAYRLQAKTNAHLQGHVDELEAQTRHLYSMNAVAVHGLLQTPDYAIAVMRLADSENMIDQSAALEARLRRQDRLHDDSRTFAFIMLEQVLRAPFMTPTQLERLARIATAHKHITVGVVPLAAQWPAVPWHGFNLYVRTDGSQVAVVELVHGEATVTGHDDLSLYRRLHDEWRSAAIVGPAAAEMCQRIASET